VSILANAQEKSSRYLVWKSVKSSTTNIVILSHFLSYLTRYSRVCYTYSSKSYLETDPFLSTYPHCFAGGIADTKQFASGNSVCKGGNLKSCHKWRLNDFNLSLSWSAPTGVVCVLACLAGASLPSEIRWGQRRLPRTRRKLGMR
jgi:hypothetical protein